MRILRWVSSNPLKNRIRNECIHRKLEAFLIEDKIKVKFIKMVWPRESQVNTASIRKNDRIIVNEVVRTRGRPKQAWMKAIKKNMLMIHASEKMTLNRNE